MTVPNGAILTTDEMRDRARQYRDVGETLLPNAMTQLAYANVYVLLEALAATKDELAQLRKEFDAMKGSIRHGGR